MLLIDEIDRADDEFEALLLEFARRGLGHRARSSARSPRSGRRSSCSPPTAAATCTTRCAAAASTTGWSSPSRSAWSAILRRTVPAANEPLIESAAAVRRPRPRPRPRQAARHGRGDQLGRRAVRARRDRAGPRRRGPDARRVAKTPDDRDDRRPAAAATAARAQGEPMKIDQRVHRQRSDRAGVGGAHRPRGHRAVHAGRPADRRRRRRLPRQGEGQGRPGRRREFAGTARFVEKDDADHRAVIDAKGRDSRGAGNASRDHHRAAAGADGDAYLVTVDTDLKISGKIAQFGSGMIKEVSGEAARPVRGLPRRKARRRRSRGPGRRFPADTACIEPAPTVPTALPDGRGPVPSRSSRGQAARAGARSSGVARETRRARRRHPRKRARPVRRAGVASSRRPTPRPWT